MKKNAMLKIAAILMVAVLLTTCAISSTFAKYTSSNSDTVTARVAKWGVEVETNIQGLFADGYKSNDSTFGVENDAVKVSTGTDKLVAPGTAKSINVAASLSGKPEVAIAIKTEAVLTLTNWNAKLNAEATSTSEYCPLVFTIAGTKYFIGQTVANEAAGDNIDVDNKITDVDELIIYVCAAIEGAGTATYAPNTDLVLDASKTNTLAYDFEIAWEWAYETNAQGYATQNDYADTYLGDQATKTTTVGESVVSLAPTVTLELTQTITQID